MSSGERTARLGARQALRTRRRLGVDPVAPIDPFSLAKKMGVQVRLRPETSLEGMYIRNPGPLVLLSTVRPQGRRAFTLCHELGHHVFDHGTQVDEYLDGSVNDGSEEERMANAFARHALMPIAAVREILERRQLNPAHLTEEEAFALSSYFGVGYSTIIHHLTWSLGLMAADHAKALNRHTPGAIKHRILGQKHNGSVEVVDHSWRHRPLDLRVGDFAVLPASSELDGPVGTIVESTSSKTVLQATRPGIGRVTCEDWSIFLRIARFEYTGLADFRHLERDDEE